MGSLSMWAINEKGPRELMLKELEVHLHPSRSYGTSKSIRPTCNKKCPDKKRYINAISYCRLMYKEYFAENYEAIGALFKEIQASEWRAVKRISKCVFVN